ncbi:MAG TPA: glycogen/starch/alpha-glucan family phosphorylase, partial [Burkholderiaceae bacterium]|nr:glycogen/starch/alpha-glucan family phosphorylase [Burkholderiaceae bacterium]
MDTSVDQSGAAARLAPLNVEHLVRRIEGENSRPLASVSLGGSMRALAHACRDELLERLRETLQADRARHARRVHYLSMEFLMGRALVNALAALGLTEEVQAVAARAGVKASDILEHETDAALGNGGLGRLAACFLDSLATLGLPAFGYGLRYEYGIFAQRICEGQQTEEPDEWLRNGNPWEVPRPELRYQIGFGGHVKTDTAGRRWIPAETVEAMAYDFIVPGHGTRRVSVLRQWKALPARPMDFAAFSRGEHAAAVNGRHSAEPITWVLYPDDSTQAGRELRLQQEFFLVSATLQDIIARHLEEFGRLDNFGAKAALHLNDTHPALAVPELLRLLIDEHGMTWDAAVVQCQHATSYTNHTLMPEALEKWPVRMFGQLLPRHLEIVYEINARFLQYARTRFPQDEALLSRISLIDEHGERHVKMAALSIVLSHRVNGVSKLHSDLMTRTIFADYAQLLPNRFCNVTNGVTPRRWLAQANPALAGLLDRRLDGEGRQHWRIALDRLSELRPLAEDAGFRQEILAAKRANKERLAAIIGRELGIAVDPGSMFDVQIKRIHEYKRQLLNVLQVVARYQALVEEHADADMAPRTVIFAGKAASAYVAAKQIIRLIHDVARIVNGDPRVRDRLKVVFLPNYGVSLAEAIIPAADLSQQISTAGTEASGTGNMKLALNGA